LPSKIDEDDSSSVPKKPKASDKDISKVAEGKAKVIKPKANPSPVPKVAFKSFFKSPEKKEKQSLLDSFSLSLWEDDLHALSACQIWQNKTYASHLLRKEIVNNSTWLSEINFSDDGFFLYENNVIQKDYPGSKYNKRLFLSTHLTISKRWLLLFALLRT